MPGTLRQGIRAFEIDLESYIENTQRCIKGSQDALDSVGYWADIYYDSTKEKTEEFSSEMTKCIEFLSEQLEWITKRRIRFEEALEMLDK